MLVTPMLQDAPPRASGVIDVHAHFLPPAYRDALSAAGLTRLDGGMPIPPWSADAALAVMDRHAVATAMLSISSPGLGFTDAAREPGLARAVNEAGAELAAAHPGRFGVFATLPLADIDAALGEIDYALDHLKLDGFILPTHHHGRYPAHADFARLFGALNARKACVFVHPTSPVCLDCVSAGRPAPLIEFPFETTRAVVDLIYGGVLRRAPDIRFIIAHAGGTLPFLAARISGFTQVLHPAPEGLTPESVLRDLASLYYDTALSANLVQMQALRQMAPVSRILFGSDWPFSPEPLLGASLAALRDIACFSAEEREGVLQANAHRLLYADAD